MAFAFAFLDTLKTVTVSLVENSACLPPGTLASASAMADDVEDLLCRTESGWLLSQRFYQQDIVSPRRLPPTVSQSEVRKDEGSTVDDALSGPRLAAGHTSRAIIES